MRKLTKMMEEEDEDYRQLSLNGQNLEDEGDHLRMMTSPQPRQRTMIEDFVSSFVPPEEAFRDELLMSEHLQDERESESA